MQGVSHVNNPEIPNTGVSLNSNGAKKKPRMIRVVKEGVVIWEQEKNQLFQAETKSEELSIKSETVVEEQHIKSEINFFHDETKVQESMSKVELSEADKYINNFETLKKDISNDTVSLKVINSDCKDLFHYLQQADSLIDVKELAILQIILIEIEKNISEKITEKKFPTDSFNKIVFFGKAKTAIQKRLERYASKNSEIKLLQPEKKKREISLPILEESETNKCKQRKLKLVRKLPEANQNIEGVTNKNKDENKSLKTLDGVINKIAASSDLIINTDATASKEIIVKNKTKICQWLNIDEGEYEKIAPELIELHRLLAGCLTEINTVENSNINEVPIRALNAILLFTSRVKIQNSTAEILCRDTLVNLRKFIKDKAANYVHPVHDIFMYNLPEVDNKDELNAWRSLIVDTIGIFALSVIDFAGDILKAESSVKSVKNKKELTQLLKNFKYTMIKSASLGLQKISGFCSENQVPENQFNKMISLDTKLKFKTKESIPNVTVYDEENGYKIKLTMSK